MLLEPVFTGSNSPKSALPNRVACSAAVSVFRACQCSPRNSSSECRSIRMSLPVNAKLTPSVWKIWRRVCVSPASKRARACTAKWIERTALSTCRVIAVPSRPTSRSRPKISPVRRSCSVCSRSSSISFFSHRPISSCCWLRAGAPTAEGLVRPRRRLPVLQV